MPGVYLPMSRRSIMLACCSASAEKAVTEMGVSCRDSSRLRAVTMISSMSVPVVSEMLIAASSANSQLGTNKLRAPVSSHWLQDAQRSGMVDWLAVSMCTHLHADDRRIEPI